MSTTYKTLLEYLKINEAKADDEYQRNYSSIEREIFNNICLMDPKTQYSGEEILNIGFSAKQLLLPKYMSGETDIIDKGDEIKTALTNYYPNIKNYPKFPEFESVEAFLSFMKDPVEVIDNPKAKKVTEDKITAIYNKYYSSIPRETFDEIIHMDPGTNSEKIGEIAKNLLLRCYQRGDTDFIKNADAVTGAIDRFINQKSSYEPEKQNLMNYSSVSEFVSYIPPSPTIISLADSRYKPVAGEDFIHIASSTDYDIFKPLTYRGSERIAHARGAQNVWCTAGGSDGTHYGATADHSVSTSYWRNYTATGSIYMFIHKTEPRNKDKNWNMSYRDGSVREFRNGDNGAPNGGTIIIDGIHKDWETFLLANPDVATVLSHSADSNLKNDRVVKLINFQTQYLSKPLIISNNSQLLDYRKNKTAYKNCVKELIIKDIKKIPACFADNSTVLEKVTIGPGVEEIGIQAFKNCPNLKSINQDLPESLKLIDTEAFMSCTALKGSIHVPDSLEAIKLRAFDGTRCKLKIDIARTKPIKFSSADRDWVNAHVLSIKK